jgi:hypothetical protein
LPARIVTFLAAQTRRQMRPLDVGGWQYPSVRWQYPSMPTRSVGTPVDAVIRASRQLHQALLDPSRHPLPAGRAVSRCQAAHRPGRQPRCRLTHPCRHGRKRTLELPNSEKVFIEKGLFTRVGLPVIRSHYNDQVGRSVPSAQRDARRTC